jgi:methionine--tRNA ligase beta chain
MITYDQFKQVEIRSGKILSAEKVPETDKLFRLVVDFNEKDELGNAKPRQIVSGIALYFPDPAVLVGKTCMFVTNLEPRTIKGLESNGMLFAVSTKEGGFSLLEPNSSIPPGTLAA